MLLGSNGYLPMMFSPLMAAAVIVLWGGRDASLDEYKERPLEALPGARRPRRAEIAGGRRLFGWAGIEAAP
jgi:hypothetical protein